MYDILFECWNTFTINGRDTFYELAKQSLDPNLKAISQVDDIHTYEINFIDHIYRFIFILCLRHLLLFVKALI